MNSLIKTNGRKWNSIANHIKSRKIFSNANQQDVLQLLGLHALADDHNELLLELLGSSACDELAGDLARTEAEPNKHQELAAGLQTQLAGAEPERDGLVHVAEKIWLEFIT